MATGQPNLFLETNTIMPFEYFVEFQSQKTRIQKLYYLLPIYSPHCSCPTCLSV